jgi:hypothetical protein
MDEKLAYWSSVVLGALALLVLVLNVSMINGNRNLQAEVNQRQATINNGLKLGQINQALVQALAEAAVRGNDEDARNLLATQGIGVKTAAKGEAKAAAPAADTDAKKKK